MQSQQPTVTSAQARALARKYSFGVGFNLERRLNRALHRLTRPTLFPALRELARFARSIEAEVSGAIPIVEQSARTDGALYAAIRAAAQTKRDMLSPPALRELETDLRTLRLKLARLRYDASKAEQRITRRRSVDDARALVRAVLPMWEEGTGHAAGYTRAPDSRRYSGQFVSFVGKVAGLASLRLSRQAIGYAIERTVRDRNRTTQEPAEIKRG